MAPSEAVEKTENLLNSTTENGVLDNKSLLVQCPVVIFSDGHSSCFDCNDLQYLHENEMRLFISSPNTTRVTQMID